MPILVKVSETTARLQHKQLEDWCTMESCSRSSSLLRRLFLSQMYCLLMVSWSCRRYDSQSRASLMNWSKTPSLKHYNDARKKLHNKIPTPFKKNGKTKLFKNTIESTLYQVSSDLEVCRVVPQVLLHTHTQLVHPLPLSLQGCAVSLITRNRTEEAKCLLRTGFVWYLKMAF